MKTKQLLFFTGLLIGVSASSMQARAQMKGVNINGPSITNNGKAWALLYQQHAAEYKALCYQAYNLAKMNLDAALKAPHKRPLAVVTDVDETVLDNSPYDAGRAINNLEFDSKTWQKWTAAGLADSVPGAPSFFRYAAAKGVTVFYVTNREETERAGTEKNLKKYSLPNVDKEHLLLKDSVSSKEIRRKKILEKYDIVLFCGDNLSDFNMVYDNKPAEGNRNEATRFMKKQFGSKYIVIPNIAYGDFEGAFFKFNSKLNNAQKDSVIRASLRTFR